MAGLTCCTGGKSHRSKRATDRRQCKWQRLEEGNVLPGQAPRVRLGVRFSRSCQQLRPVPGPTSRLADRAIVRLRCCILLLYQARELRAQDFEFVSLT